MTPHSLRSLLVLALAATVAACGGGTDAGPGPVATPNLTMKGVITARAAGQITVNGVALATPATVKIEKVEQAESELKKGMVQPWSYPEKPSGRYSPP